MAPRIDYKASVAADLETPDLSGERGILGKIERALRSEGQSGSPLSGEFEGLYRLRVEGYRVTYARTTEGYLILRIGRPHDVYQKGIPKRKGRPERVRQGAKGQAPAPREEGSPQRREGPVLDWASWS